MSQVSNASIFGSAVVGVLAGAAVGGVITAFLDDDTDEQQKRNGTIENVCIIAGAVLGISVYLGYNKS
jgi:hypothetical protein